MASTAELHYLTELNLHKGKRKIYKYGTGMKRPQAAVTHRELTDMGRVNKQM